PWENVAHGDPTFWVGGKDVRLTRQPPPRGAARGGLASDAARCPGSPRLRRSEALLRAALRGQARLGRDASRRPSELEEGGAGRPGSLPPHHGVRFVRARRS